ncbi:MAG: sigma-70 family RNA polymerase sigma factor [Planctomycetota bacterium]
MGGAQPSNNKDQMSRMAMLWGKALPSVSAFVHSIVRNQHDVDDVLQATVSYIAEHFEDYEPGTPFVAWAISVARFRVMEYRHQNKRQPLLLGDDSMASLSTAMIKEAESIDDRLEALEHCIGRLGERHQQVLADRYYEQQSREQIAEALGIKVNSVSVMLLRIRQVLHDCINSRLERIQ